MPESILENIGEAMDDGSRCDDEDTDVERDPEALLIELDTYEEHEG